MLLLPASHPVISLLVVDVYKRQLWASEIEAFPIRVTKRHFPNMRHVGDITKLDGAQLPPVDIICGGSPCQDCLWPVRGLDYPARVPASL